MRTISILCLALNVTAALADDTPPKPAPAAERIPLQTVVPVYPDTARRERLEGEVEVCFDVDRQGRPYRIAVRNSTHRVFERPAIDAVRASAYVALKPGEPLPNIKTCRTFRFTLEPAQEEAASASTRPAASPSVDPMLTRPSSWPAITATPMVRNPDSRQSRSTSRAISGVP
jgi:TonB family protein